MLSGMHTHAAPSPNRTNRCNHLDHPPYRHAAEVILTSRGGMTGHHPQLITPAAPTTPTTRTTTLTTGMLPKVSSLPVAV